jgi:peptidoglycan-N-acetylglucosamine deacetylase
MRKRGREALPPPQILRHDDLRQAANYVCATAAGGTTMSIWDGWRIDIRVPALAAAIAVVCCVAGTAEAQRATQAACAAGDGLGVSRVIEIDTTGGPLFGDTTKFQKEASFLQPKEVVLTFDDGPLPAITRPILDILDSHCTKATFFQVGQMAAAYPGDVQNILARGHTVGTHTWSHPLNIRRLKPEAALTEIEKGFAAVAAAAGQPIAPFFRFPGLSDNASLLTHLQSRGVGTFTVDVVSNDSYIHDAEKLVRVTMERVEARQGGILLFHDIKAATARALPTILAQLKALGYKVVHMRSKHPFVPAPQYGAQFANLEAKAPPRPALVPFFSTRTQPASVDTLAPEPKTFVAPPPRASRPASIDSLLAEHGAAPRQRVKVAKVNRFGSALPMIGSWTTTVKPPVTLKKDRRADTFR